MVETTQTMRPTCVECGSHEVGQVNVAAFWDDSRGEWHIDWGWGYPEQYYCYGCAGPIDEIEYE